jgi:3-oxoacyl-[acyl-carrier-protein] synthase-3
MASLTVKGVAIKGIASAVPQGVQGEEDLARRFGAEDARNLAKSTGVLTRRIARPDQCCSDLCFAAANLLFESLDWNRQSVDALVYVSQSTDHPLPSTACILQNRLGLPKTCAAFDVGLGCSGFVYGLWIASGLISSGCNRVLLLSGETPSRGISPFDRTVLPLFGDAGTATAVEAEEGAVIHFELGSDGSGARHLIMPSGHAYGRIPHSAETMVRTLHADGIMRNAEELFMDGKEIFVFTLTVVPPLVAAVLRRAKWEIGDVDRYMLHQANRFMLEYLVKRMKLPPDRVPIVTEHYGNTGGASIPLAITHAVRVDLEKGRMKVVLAAFGVGFSWGAAALEMGPIVAPPLLEVP